MQLLCARGFLFIGGSAKSVHVEIFSPGDNPTYDGKTDLERINITRATEGIADGSHKYEYISSKQPPPRVSCAGDAHHYETSGGMYTYATAQLPLSVASVHYEMVDNSQ